MQTVYWTILAVTPTTVIACGSSSSSEADAGPEGTDAGALGDAGGDDDASLDSGADADAEPDPDRDTMALIPLPDSEARGTVCNDGSPAGYYYRPGIGTGSRVWVIHLQGGGMCFDLASCDARAIEFPERMTSDSWPAERPGAGAQSADPIVNPDFWNANHVYLPYCSSDLWSGDREASDETAGRSFRGARIVRAVLDALADPLLTPAPDLLDAARVLLSGSSAGGAGVLVHLDAVAQSLETADVRGVCDAGWFVDLATYDPELPALRDAAFSGRGLWNGEVDSSCDAAHPEDPSVCMVGPSVYPEIETPMLVQIAQRDGPQLGLLGIRPPLDDDEREYIASFAAAVAASLEPVEACFSPAGSTHGLMANENFQLAIQGETFRDVLGRFFFDRPGSVHIVEQ